MVGAELRFEEGIECLAPSAIGSPELCSFLWVRPKGTKAWTRRFCVQKANFIYWFAEKDAAAPTKALGALCFEDLIFEWVEPPPTEPQVAAFAQFAFNVRPDPIAKSKGFDRRSVQFCAETETVMQDWTKALMIWKFDLLAEDRKHLTETRGQLSKCRSDLRDANERAQRAEEARAAAEAEAEEHGAVRAELEGQLHETVASHEAQVEDLEAEIAQLREALQVGKGGHRRRRGGEEASEARRPGERPATCRYLVATWYALARCYMLLQCRYTCRHMPLRAPPHTGMHCCRRARRRARRPPRALQRPRSRWRWHRRPRVTVL